MSAIAEPAIRLPRARPTRTAGALATLARRRAALTASNPRQILVPLLGPAILAMVVAPALKVATGGLHSHIDYQSFVGVGTVGLVVPLSCIFAGLSVIVDRHSGAQRELLAAPVPRAYLVIGNLMVALALSALQVIVLIGLSAARGGSFHITATGVAWFAAAALLFTVFMYGVAEALAARIAKQEEYIGATPVVAILPFFLAGALFPIGAMPAFLTWIAKFMPLTHARANALRVRRPGRQRATRHLGTGQRDRGGLAQPGRHRGVRRGPDDDRNPGVLALRGQMTGAVGRGRAPRPTVSPHRRRMLASQSRSGARCRSRLHVARASASAVRAREALEARWQILVAERKQGLGFGGLR
ncbi:MAG: ABC transporter permease [Solirubrobacteraceae bacterium]